MGRQALDIEILRKENEQLKSMLLQAQNGITEAQEVAKKLHQQIQESAMENHGAELAKQDSTYSTK